MRFFQSPFRRGNGCYESALASSLNLSIAFSPLFVGAMVATTKWALSRSVWHAFSPLFVGAMVATLCGFLCVENGFCFQSPFRRGNGCYERVRTGSKNCNLLSVPFSSGQWLLHGISRSFVPIVLLFQSPFRRGNGCYSTNIQKQSHVLTFQSPFRRGNGCYLRPPDLLSSGFGAFSPLFVGAMVATTSPGTCQLSITILSVPFSSGQWLLLGSWQ